MRSAPVVRFQSCAHGARMWRPKNLVCTMCACWWPGDNVRSAEFSLWVCVAVCSLALYVKNMSDVIEILSAIELGDPSAADQLIPLVYDELRKLDPAKRSEVERICHEIETEQRDTDAILKSLQIRLMVGFAPSVVRQRAQELLPSAIELGMKDKLNIRFLAGEVPASALEHQFCFLRFFDPALVSYARGDMKQARRYFEQSVDVGYIEDNYWWAKYFLKQMDQEQKNSTASPPE